MKLFEVLRKQTPASGTLSDFRCSIPNTRWVVERVDELRGKSTDLLDLAEECGPFSQGLEAVGVKIAPEQIAQELQEASQLRDEEWRPLKSYLLEMA